MPLSLDVRKRESKRRSPCPVAGVLDILGDRWTLLVIRDLMLGKSRFKEFMASPEGIPTNILSDRLERLLQHKLVRQVHAARGSKHLCYQLTPKGLALRPILTAIKKWGLVWVRGTWVGMQKSFVSKENEGGFRRGAPTKVLA